MSDAVPSVRRRDRALAFARDEWRLLTTVQPSRRPWQMPFAAALASGLPLLVGAALDEMPAALVASLGGLAFLYLPDTPMHHRMVTVMTCAFGMTTSYTFGLLGHLVPALTVPAIAFVAAVVTMACRYYAAAPPGALFFVMAAAIGAYAPRTTADDVPRLVGLMSLGALLACLIAFAYSLATLRRVAPRPITPAPPATFDFVVFDSVVIGCCVGASLLLAQALRLEKPYWVPVSCLAVIQVATFRKIWTRQLHRVVGTVAGLAVTWALFALLPIERWTVAVAVIALTFVVETAVVRNYAFAAAFITPLAILIADAAAARGGDVWPLISARLWDTVLGCGVALVGGAALHSPAFRRRVGAPMRRLIPRRLLVGDDREPVHSSDGSGLGSSA